MSHPTILRALENLVGKKITVFFDDIHKAAEARGYSVNIQDPAYNPRSIDNDDHRLNVKTKDGIITAFTIG